MIPGITERQAGYASEVAARSTGGRSHLPAPGPQPRRHRGGDARATGPGGRRHRNRDAHLQPGDADCPGLLDCRVPLLLANIQPERVITAAWDMADLTYNQGIHGAQDQANALVRTRVPFSVLTGDSRSERFGSAFEDWARAAHTVTRLRHTRIALLGYPMNGMGDILYHPPAMPRRLVPRVVCEDLGGLQRGTKRSVTPRRVDAWRHHDALRSRPTAARQPRLCGAIGAGDPGDAHRGRLRRLLVPLRLARWRRTLPPAAAAGCI